MEERLVAGHCIEQQRLVSGCWLRLEIFGVAEVHRHGLEPFEGAGHLRVETEPDPFVRLNPEHQRVWTERPTRRVAEQHQRGSFELYRHFRHTAGQLLAGSQIERHARPAPVVEEQAHRHERLGA